MGRIAAIDYGIKRIGIALSDENQSIALPFATIAGGKGGPERVAKELQAKKVEAVIVGLPLLMNGKKGDMAIAVEQFAKELETLLGLPIILKDERLSSKHAEAVLRETNYNRKERAERLDASAAALLLQSYLDAKSNDKNRPF